MNELTLAIAIWAFVSVEQFVTGCSFRVIGKYLKPNGWAMTGLGFGYIGYSVFNIATIAFVIYLLAMSEDRSKLQPNAALTVTACVRTFAGVLIGTFQTLMAAFGAYRMAKADAATRELVSQVHRSVLNLNKAIKGNV